MKKEKPSCGFTERGQNTSICHAIASAKAFFKNKHTVGREITVKNHEPLHIGDL